jgi:hypothetical protein
MSPKHRSWREQLPGAFAFQAAPFAGHPLDEQRAVAMLHSALRAGATDDEIIEAATTYLISQKVSSEEIDRQIERIREFKPRPSAKVRSSRAWLVTLESTDKPPQVISVFRAQRSAEFVRDYVEQYYIDTFYSLQEKLLYAQSRKNNPYPATFDRLDGISWQGRITCGHNPYLYARLVLKLRVQSSPQGDRLVWEESPVPNLAPR